MEAKGQAAWGDRAMDDLGPHFSQVGASLPPPAPPFLLAMAGCSMMAWKSRVPRSALVSGRWPLGASSAYMNSEGHLLPGAGRGAAAGDSGRRAPRRSRRGRPPGPREPSRHRTHRYTLFSPCTQSMAWKNLTHCWRLCSQSSRCTL